MKNKRADFAIDQMGIWMWAVLILAILIVIMIVIAKRGDWALGNIGDLFRFGVS
jgi:hypothetical protein